MAFAIDSEVHGYHIYIDFWSASLGILLSKVCNCEDQYAITHAHSNALKSSRDAVMGIYFCRKAVTRNLFLKRKASSKYPKIKNNPLYTVCKSTARPKGPATSIQSCTGCLKSQPKLSSA